MLTAPILGHLPAIQQRILASAKVLHLISFHWKVSHACSTEPTSIAQPVVKDEPIDYQPPAKKKYTNPWGKLRRHVDLTHWSIE